MAAQNALGVDTLHVQELRVCSSCVLEGMVTSRQDICDTIGYGERTKSGSDRGPD